MSKKYDYKQLYEFTSSKRWAYEDAMREAIKVLWTIDKQGDECEFSIRNVINILSKPLPPRPLFRADDFGDSDDEDEGDYGVYG